MAEWLCRGLQILVQRFNSASGLSVSNPLANLSFGFTAALWRCCCFGGDFGGMERKNTKL